MRCLPMSICMLKHFVALNKSLQPYKAEEQTRVEQKKGGRFCILCGDDNDNKDFDEAKFKGKGVGTGCRGPC